MSIRQGKKLIASSTTNGFSLFDCKWADHILNNISWLRADTFSWHSGDVYVAAYEHLADDLEEGIEIITAIESITMIYYRTPSADVVINGTQYYAWTSGAAVCLTTSATPQTSDSVYNQDGTDRYGGIQGFYTYIRGTQTDTIGDITIDYYLGEDGHKICLPDQESDISALYEATGVAWYYILDKENKQFKLPRTKFGFTGIRNGVGGYVAPGLPNITGAFNCDSKNRGASGVFALQDTASVKDSYSSTYDTLTTYNFNASRSNSIYGNSDTVQPQATEMYLYFYVGNYVENATTVDVGKLTEIVNDFDIDTFKPEVDEAKNEAIVDINDAKTDAIGSITNLATDLGTSLKYGNVGDIFYTSRLDVSLNGAVECNGNLYNTTDFSGAQSIGNLLRDSKVPYISLAEHQTTVDTYGSCRCFGWDGGTEFRVPKLTDVFIEAGIAASEGEFITAGLPNITGQVSQIDFSGSRSFSGAFINVSSPSGDTGATHSGGTRTTVGFNASQSNSIYGNSTTVQPPAVRYRAMVQLAFGATDDALITVGGVLNDIVNLKNAVSPVGTIIAFAGTTPPQGWLICDGGEISRDSYVSLFSVIGETYGAGDGATSFNLPDESVLPLGTMANVKVFGNGYTLGWTRSTAGDSYYPTIPPPVTGTEGLGIGAATTTKYAVGATTPAAIEATQKIAYGISTNPNYSGLTGTVDLSTATGAKAIVCIKY